MFCDTFDDSDDNDNVHIEQHSDTDSSIDVDIDTNNPFYYNDDHHLLIPMTRKKVSLCTLQDIIPYIELSVYLICFFV